MPVSDTEVAALRAQLTGDFDEFRRLAVDFRKPGKDAGYTALVFAAYFEAVTRRFDDGWAESDVIEFVSSMRSRGERAAEKVDPEIAERVILDTIGDGEPDEIEDIADGDLVRHRFFVLQTITTDKRYSDDGLDEFLSIARATGDKVLSLHQDPGQS